MVSPYLEGFRGNLFLRSPAFLYLTTNLNRYEEDRNFLSLSI